MSGQSLLRDPRSVPDDGQRYQNLSLPLILGYAPLAVQDLLTHYTDQHPDVVTAKSSIKKLEAQIIERDGRLTISKDPQGTSPLLHPTLTRLNQELQEVVDQIHRFTGEQIDLKNQIVLYQRRVENTPKREEQMSTLLRDYRLLQENYQSLRERLPTAGCGDRIGIAIAGRSLIDRMQSIGRRSIPSSRRCRQGPRTRRNRQCS